MDFWVQLIWIKTFIVYQRFTDENFFCGNFFFFL